ncbi:DNA transposition protein [Canicola haemoglobinophilus]|uniref:DNA transposition protein n=3 Tax=Canicola haemoglobinophilus TaxID=733 RepID=A0A377HRW9_9PAST|nr:AAA family ATPase [Canicola haemoglobinophilus]STO59194.1 DNA transposition protein [Canicola haemoglobinophilus]
MNVIEQVRQHIAETGATQTRIAKEAGLSAGALSAYLSESYKGNIEEVEAKLTAYFERLAQKLREFIEAPSFIETKTATQIFSTLRFAQNANVLAIIHGASGVGKTQAAREYRRRYNNVWVVTASPSRSSLSEILYEIALEVGISDAPRRKGTLSRLIARKIKGTEGLLIVDEADHLPYEALEELRLLQEKITNESDIGSGVGLVLIGNDKVYTRIKGGINPAHEYGRLWSRNAKRTSIQKTKQADTKAVAEAWGLRDNQEVLEVMQRITETGGGLRILTHTLRLAGMVAKGSNRLIDADLITQARAELLGKGE